MCRKATFPFMFISGLFLLLACVYASLAASYLPELPVQSVFVNAAGDLWLIGTAGGDGIYRWDGTGFQDYGHNLGCRDVLAIVQRQTDGGMLFIGTWGEGVYRRAPGASKWERFSRGIDSDYDYIRAMAQGPDGTLYAMDPRRRVYRLPPWEQSWQSMPATGLPGSQARSLFVGQDGQLYMGFIAEGTYVFTGSSWARKGDLRTTVGAIDAGADGSLWAGTDLGVFRWKDGSWQNMEGPAQVTALKVNPHHPDEVVVGTANGQVYRYRENTGWNWVDTPGSRVWALGLAADEPQSLLVGTDRGLHVTTIAHATPTPLPTATPRPEEAMIISLRHSVSASENELRYTISYRNRYPEPVHGVVITNLVPAKLEPLQGSYGNATPVPVDGSVQLKWELGTVNTGGYGNVGYSVAVAPRLSNVQPPAEGGGEHGPVHGGSELAVEPEPTIPPPTAVPPTPTPTVTPMPPPRFKNDGAWVQWTIGGKTYSRQSNADVYPSCDVFLPMIAR